MEELDFSFDPEKDYFEYLEKKPRSLEGTIEPDFFEREFAAGKRDRLFDAIHWPHYINPANPNYHWKKAFVLAEKKIHLAQKNRLLQILEEQQNRERRIKPARTELTTLLDVPDNELYISVEPDREDFWNQVGQGNKLRKDDIHLQYFLLRAMPKKAAVFFISTPIVSGKIAVGLGKALVRQGSVFYFDNHPYGKWSYKIKDIKDPEEREIAQLISSEIEELVRNSDQYKLKEE